MAEKTPSRIPYSDLSLPDAFAISNRLPFFLGGLSQFVDGGTNFEFKIKRAVITPHTTSLARQLNASPSSSCGQKGAWQQGVPQDVTPTGGCAGMGLKIPLLEYDLLKMESTHRGTNVLLFLGQTETERESAAFGKRPTSYQPALIQCHARPGYHILTNELFPTRSHHGGGGEREETALERLEARVAALTGFGSGAERNDVVYGMNLLLVVLVCNISRLFV